MQVRKEQVAAVTTVAGAAAKPLQVVTLATTSGQLLYP